KVLVLDRDFDLLVDHRVNPDRCETCMAPRIGVERRYPHQAMDTALGLEPAIGVLTDDAQCRRFDAGLFPRTFFEPFDLVAVLLGPPRVHARQDLRPILRLGAAGAGVDLEIGVIVIRFAGQQALELALPHLLLQSRESAIGLGDHRLIAFGLRQLEKLERLLKLALDREAAVDTAVEPRALAHQRLGARRIVPKLGVFDERVQLGEAPGCVIPVKDASSTATTSVESRRPPLQSQRASRRSSRRSLISIARRCPRREPWVAGAVPATSPMS